MNKLIITAILLSTIAIVFSIYTLQGDSLGYSPVPIFYYGATNASSSIPQTATTTNPILARDDSRTNAKICYLTGTSTAFLHPKSQSTTTGVIVNEGIPLFATTTGAQVCQEFQGFRGILFGISAQPVTVTVSQWK